MTLVTEGGQLVDVRTPAEFNQGAVPGALNLPVQAINQAPRILDREKPVLLYCRTGQRSAYAKMAMNAMGFDNVVDLGAPYYFADCLAQLERALEPSSRPLYA
jgi:rhodanese-related sulfurtransferase